MPEFAKTHFLSKTNLFNMNHSNPFQETHRILVFRVNLKHRNSIFNFWKFRKFYVWIQKRHLSQLNRYLSSSWSLGSVLERLVLKNYEECTSRCLKRTSGARVMICFLSSKQRMIGRTDGGRTAKRTGIGSKRQRRLSNKKQFFIWLGGVRFDPPLPNKKPVFYLGEGVVALRGR